MNIPLAQKACQIGPLCLRRKNRSVSRPLLCALLAGFALVIVGCATIPIKQYYLLNYIPSELSGRLNATQYPCAIRLRDMDIEQAYDRSQIVYRQSPFQLRYYVYRVWAVKPTLMITDLIRKHLQAINLVSYVTRRFDEDVKPDYELSGTIESIEEYDSENVWFAHLSLWLRVTRLRDGKMVYSRHFDNRKEVFKNNPEFVIREMSSIMEYVMNQVAHDLDVVLARDFGISSAPPNQSTFTDSTSALPDQAK